MENSFFKFFKMDGVIEHIKGYVETKIQLFKMEALEWASRIIASLIFVILLFFSFIMMLIFGSIAVGNYINQLFNNSYAGFVIIALFYLVMVIVLGVSITHGILHRLVFGLILSIFRGKKKK